MEKSSWYRDMAAEERPEEIEVQRSRILSGRTAALVLLTVALVVIVIIVVLLGKYGPVTKSGVDTGPPPPRPPTNYCISNEAGVCVWSQQSLCELRPEVMGGYQAATFDAPDALTCSDLLGAYTSSPIVAGEEVTLSFTDPGNLPHPNDLNECFAAVMATGTGFAPELGTMSFVRNGTDPAEFKVFSATFDASVPGQFRLFCNQMSESCLGKGVSYSFSEERAATLVATSNEVCSSLPQSF